MSSSAGHRIETARVRRAPRYGVFLMGGALLGILVALILTFAFDDSEKSAYTGVVYSTAQVFGFIALICVPTGIALGGAVALVLDRVVGRRTREVRIDRETVHAHPDEA